MNANSSYSGHEWSSCPQLVDMFYKNKTRGNKQETQKGK